MKMSLIEIILLGRKYLSLWPNKTELQNFFDVYRQVIISRFVCRYAIHFAMLIITLPFILNSNVMIQQTVVSVIFVLSMPVQAYVMLGLQADKSLPPSLAAWYKEGVARINEQGSNSIKLSVHKPRYMDLVELLNLSYGRTKH